MESPAPRTSLKKWLLRLFLASFLLAVLLPVVVAVAILRLSADTRTLRDAAIEESGTRWDRKIEVRAGSVPFMLARIAMPFAEVPWEAQQAISALHSAEVSVHELRGPQPDRSRMITEADKRMSKRGWDRLVGVVEGETVVAVYAKPTGEAKLKFSVLVLADKMMVAVSGRGDLAPIFNLAMEKAYESVPELRRATIVAKRD